MTKEDKNWLKNKDNFEVFDVRKLTGNFFPAIYKKAQKLEINQGLCIVQSFEPIPLYSSFTELGYEYFTEKVSETEYRAYFYRVRIATAEKGDKKSFPFKPTAIVNFNTIDPKLANKVVNFWDYIWGQEESAIDAKTKLLLSLANGVGAGRMRQAVREFVKAYAIGVTTEEFSEIFAMFAWNMGIGHFASEIGPSALFGAYKLVKTLEEKGKEREEIIQKLLEKFGEKNPDVNTFFKSKK
jgi:alkylhydroperoxidase/carboxymuconolactone decarboxylase family protein YurZ